MATELNRISKAEWELIQMIRAMPQGAIGINRFDGRVLITIVDEPNVRSRVQVGEGADFERAWETLSVRLPGLPKEDDQ